MKQIKDPIYNKYISINGCFAKIVESDFFRRLNKIKVLPFIYPFFPKALKNTEFSHALGVMFLAETVCELHPKDLADFKDFLKTASLIHYMIEFPIDGPFDRALSKMGISNTEKRIETLLERTIIGDYVKQLQMPFTAQDLIDINLGNFEKDRRLNTLFNSIVGIKKIDYLPRDAFYLGIELGETLVDHVLLFAMMDLSDRDYIHIRPDGLYAFENLFSAYNIMFTEFYLGPKKHTLDDMFERAVTLAIEGGILNLESSLTLNMANRIDFFDWDDDNFLDYLMRLAVKQGKRPHAKQIVRIIRDIQETNFYKLALDNPIPVSNKELRNALRDGQTLRAIEEKIATQCGIDSKADIIVSSPINQLELQLGRSSNRNILVDNELLINISPSIRSLIESWSELQVIYVYSSIEDVAKRNAIKKSAINVISELETEMKESC